MDSYFLSFLGGGLIGIAVSLMLFLNGRVAGVSGIVNGILKRLDGDLAWRIAFILGLICGGTVLQRLNPDVFNNNLNPSIAVLVIAGLLVGYGTVMGSGCTSGHGICGLSRWSRRSLVATAVFMFFGILTATLFRVLGEIS